MVRHLGFLDWHYQNALSDTKTERMSPYVMDSFLQCILKWDFLYIFPPKWSAILDWWNDAITNTSDIKTERMNHHTLINDGFFLHYMLKLNFWYIFPPKWSAILNFWNETIKRHFPTWRREEWAIIRPDVMDSFPAMHVTVQFCLIDFPAKMGRHLGFLE